MRLLPPIGARRFQSAHPMPGGALRGRSAADPRVSIRHEHPTVLSQFQSASTKYVATRSDSTRRLVVPILRSIHPLEAFSIHPAPRRELGHRSGDIIATLYSFNPPVRMGTPHGSARRHGSFNPPTRNQVSFTTANHWEFQSAFLGQHATDFPNDVSIQDGTRYPQDYRYGRGGFQSTHASQTSGCLTFQSAHLPAGRWDLDHGRCHYHLVVFQSACGGRPTIRSSGRPSFNPPNFQ